MTLKRLNNLVFYLSMLFSILGLGACTKDEEEMMILFPEHLRCDEEIGAFSLLPSSLSYTPYPGRDSVSFVDSLGTSIVFSLNEGELDDFQGALIKYDVNVPGDTVRYCYQAEKKSFVLEHKEKDLRFILTIESSLDYNLSAPGKVSDVFNIWYSYPDPPPYGASQVFFATIALRTGSYTDQNIDIPEMRVFGKTFSDVERTNFSSPSVVVWYNQTEGIVCFKAPDGRRWRFDGFK